MLGNTGLNKVHMSKLSKGYQHSFINLVKYNFVVLASCILLGLCCSEDWWRRRSNPSCWERETRKLNVPNRHPESLLRIQPRNEHIRFFLSNWEITRFHITTTIDKSQIAHQKVKFVVVGWKIFTVTCWIGGCWGCRSYPSHRRILASGCCEPAAHRRPPIEKGHEGVLDADAVVLTPFTFSLADDKGTETIFWNFSLRRKGVTIANKHNGNRESWNASISSALHLNVKTNSVITNSTGPLLFVCFSRSIVLTVNV